MSNIAIQVEKLSKRYKIGTARYRHDSIRDHVTEWAKSLFVRNGRHAVHGAKSEAQSAHSDAMRLAPRALQPSPDGYFWALKDVSFEVKQGEVVGVIGRNGAGKSTLLKILSRITDPTSGFADIHGRIGSLLEVGTGFHRDLTGRENIYLNGAILGMKKSEIDSKFDQIVDFSGIEKFIDTPVKRYSSGMYVRLAFSVAAHLEPDILIVDEVLAVGDVAFQKKCLGKMSDSTLQGRTILFVSHNMAAIQALCARCLLLESGEVVLDGTAKAATERYLMNANENAVQERVVKLWTHPRRLSNMTPALMRMWMTDESGTITSKAPMGDGVTFHVQYQTEGSVQQPIVGLTFETATGESVCGTNNRFGAGAKITDAPLAGVLSCHIPRLPLLAGEYFVTVAFAKCIDENFDKVTRAFKLTVLPADLYGTGQIPEIGNCILDANWEFNPNRFT